MDNLEKLGFTKNLSAVYLALLNVGQLRAGGVIKETNLQRSVVYSSLEELVSRNLITKTITKGVAVFRANDPKSLVDEAESRRKLAEEVSKELSTKQDVGNREIKTYEGDDISERVADKSLEVLEQGETVYFLGSAKYGTQANLERYWQKWHKKRIEKGILCKILYDKDTNNETVNDRNELQGCEAKYMPFGSDLPMWFNIFGDYVVMLIPSEEPPIAFLIKSRATAEALSKYFQFLWNYQSLEKNSQK